MAGGRHDARPRRTANEFGAHSAIFDQVFMILEDYSVEPDLAEPGDLDDDELRTAVHGAWEAFRRSGAERNR